MRARDLDHAVELQNGTPYGLTAGLQALDPAEIEHWTERVEAGNLYVNRSTTGAIVQRQPFGGWKRSSVGVRVKAGGPNYVAAFGRWEDNGPSSAASARQSFQHWWEREMAAEHDPSALRAESNVFRYVPLRLVVLRVGPNVEQPAVDIALAAATAAGASVTVSMAPEANARVPSATVESNDELCARLSDLDPTVVRLLGDADESLLRGLHRCDIAVDRRSVVAHGRVELLRWVHEQAVSRTMHRYGNVY
jgi:RHH-type proline utilization regulon transcriptional repressor/proline dehydrogenase/delta 1-pyrroline-5-carboxylate dehydrogenase